MKRVIICTIFLFLSLHSTKVFCQERAVNEVEIFKMQLFLDKKINKDDNVVKDGSLYTEFVNKVDIKLDLLKSRGFNETIKFYYLDADKNISLKIDPYSNKDFFFQFHMGFYTTYVLCVNIKNGKSYRILGFDGNDFLDFINDYTNDKEISVKQFFKSCWVNGVDFECLYKGLKDREENRYKYPCLKRVSDPIVVS